MKPRNSYRQPPAWRWDEVPQPSAIHTVELPLSSDRPIAARIFVPNGPGEDDWREYWIPRNPAAKMPLGLRGQ